MTVTKMNLPTIQRDRPSTLDHFFNSFVNQGMGPEQLRMASSHPPVDISETADAYRFAFDLPGMSREDIELSCENRVLRIRGERQLDQDQNVKRLVAERFGGEFSRSFSLPAGARVDGIEARFDKGVLHVTIPKQEDLQPRQITID